MSLSLRERGLKSYDKADVSLTFESLSLRERGLKYNISRYIGGGLKVALLARAWIEIFHGHALHSVANSRSPCESVD